MQGMNDRQLTEYRRKHLGYVFQAYNLIGNLTVRENIEVGAYLSSRPLDIDEPVSYTHLFLSTVTSISTALPFKETPAL